MFTTIALVHDFGIGFAIRALHAITYYIGIESLQSDYNTLWHKIEKTTRDCGEYTLAICVLKEFLAGDL
jgi:hypothetical protein